MAKGGEGSGEPYRKMNALGVRKKESLTLTTEEVSRSMISSGRPSCLSMSFSLNCDSHVGEKVESVHATCEQH